MRFRHVLAALVLVSGGAALAAHDWKQRLAQLPATEDSNARIDQVRSVEPNDKGAVRALLAVISLHEPNRMDGHIRAVAIEKLAAVTDEKAIEEIAKALGSKDPYHREAAAMALGRMKAKGRLDAVAKALDDKEPAVRRAALRGVASYGDLAGVDPLLARWARIDKAKDRPFREVLLILAGLEKLTEQSFGRHLDRWTEFWAKAKDGYRRPSEMTEAERKAAAEKERYRQDEDSKKEELSTTVRDVPIKITAQGSGQIPLLVIHDDSWNPSYFAPYLSSLDDVCRIYTVELPSITKLKIKKRNIGGFPYWPYDELCDAFDEIRKQYKHEKFAILAHGFSSMIGMHYLSKHPDNVSHLIVVGSFPGDDNYDKMLDKLSAKATGQLHDRELDHAVKFHEVTDEKTFTYFYSPKTNEELEALDRKFFSLMFTDQQDPELAEIWARCRKPASTDLKVMKDEQCESPPFDIAREQHPSVPVLVISGARSLWFGEADGMRVQKNYPVSEHVVLKNTSMMPWFEENEAFTEAVKAFFTTHPAAAGKK